MFWKIRSLIRQNAFERNFEISSFFLAPCEGEDVFVEWCRTTSSWAYGCCFYYNVTW